MLRHLRYRYIVVLHGTLTLYLPAGKPTSKALVIYAKSRRSRREQITENVNFREAVADPTVDFAVGLYAFAEVTL